MSTHLQRLYDAAGAVPATVDVRPAQRSSSPLLAMDQRLATTAYATSFLLSPPAEPDSEPDSEPGPGPAALSRPSRDEAAVRDETTARGGPRRPPPARIREAETEARVDPRPRPDARRAAPSHPGPPVEPRIGPTDAPPVVHAQPRPSRPTRPAPGLPPTPETAEPPPRVRERTDAGPLPVGPERVVERLAEPVLELPVTSRPDPLPAQKQAGAVPVTANRSDAAPRLLHPLPAPAPEPLPPPATPRATDLAGQVRRLVREELSRGTATPRPAGDREPGAPADADPPAPRPGTAEAMSVIGPLERPARSTTLYGLRLR